MGTHCHCVYYTEIVTVVDVVNFLTHVYKPQQLILLKTTYLYQRLDIGGKRERNSVQASDAEALF